VHHLAPSSRTGLVENRGAPPVVRDHMDGRMIDP